jgi:hypothetical protein
LGGEAASGVGASPSAPATGVGDVADAALAGSRRSARVAQRLRRSYGIIVLVAFVGAIALLVRERSRLT